MLNLELINIIEACGGEVHFPQDLCWEEKKHMKIKNAVSDSRKVEEGSVFVAIKGEKTDGHNYITDVFNKGALAVICEKFPEKLTGICIKVENSVEAVQKAAEFYRNRLGEEGLKVVGITGSVGKTSTREFVAEVLSQKYRVHRTHGNQNNLLGLPLEILSIEPDTEIAVLEMGISEFGEMRILSSMAKPDVAVITNIGECHLENLGSRDGVLKEKSDIFTCMSENGAAVLNGLDDKLVTVSSVNGKTPYRFGGNTDMAYAGEIKNAGFDGSDAKIIVNVNGSDSIDVHVPLPGEHMVSNAVAAALIGTLLGVDKEAIRQGIEAVKPTGGRSNIIKTDKYNLIDDCYNANPRSMAAAINLLKLAKTRKVAILGDMYELGEDELIMHRGVGENAASVGIDVMVFIGEMSEYMMKGAEAKADLSKQKLYYFKTKEEMLQKSREILEEGDTVLIKASNGMKFKEVLEALKN